MTAIYKKTLQVSDFIKVLKRTDRRKKVDMGGPRNDALIVVVALCLAGSAASRGGWSSARATYYGDAKGAETMSWS